MDYSSFLNLSLSHGLQKTAALPSGGQLLLYDDGQVLLLVDQARDNTPAIVGDIEKIVGRKRQSWQASWSFIPRSGVTEGGGRSVPAVIEPHVAWFIDDYESCREKLSDFILGQ